MDALTTGHDNHLMKINDRETLLVTRLNAWKAALIKGVWELQLHSDTTTQFLFLHDWRTLFFCVCFVLCLYGLLQIQDKELKWNRIRISDIHRYVDHLKEQLAELQ